MIPAIHHAFVPLSDHNQPKGSGLNGDNLEQNYSYSQGQENFQHARSHKKLFKRLERKVEADTPSVEIPSNKTGTPSPGQSSRVESHIFRYNHLRECHPILTKSERALSSECDLPAVSPIAVVPKRSHARIGKENKLQRMDSNPKLVIPKPTSLRDTDRFGLDESERANKSSSVPQFSPKQFPQKTERRERNNSHRTHENSLRYKKLSSDTDDDRTEIQNCEGSHRQIDDDAFPQPTKHDQHAREFHDENSLSNSKHDELSSSTCATRRSWLPSLISHSSRTVDAQHSLRFQKGATRSRQALERPWYERRDSQKGKSVADEPHPMEMVFFDKEETGSVAGCLDSCSKADEREGALLEDETSNHNISTVQTNDLSLELSDSPKSPAKRRTRGSRLIREVPSDHSPTFTPKTFDSHSQSDGWSNTTGLRYAGSIDTHATKHITDVSPIYHATGIRRDSATEPLRRIGRVCGGTIEILWTMTSSAGYATIAAGPPLCGGAIANLRQV